MKTLLVGDLHGQYMIAKIALEQGMPVIFMGDYLDSFTVSVGTQIELLQLVLKAVEDGQAQALMGNHEMSYLVDRMRCSGYKPVTESHVMHMDLSPLKSYIKAEGFLLTHAGVSQRLLDHKGVTLDEYLEAGSYNQIGRYRGGRDLVGGLYWCDWNQDFDPIPDQPQVVGHTRGKLIRQNGNSYCIDVLEDTDIQFGLIDNGEFSIYRP